MSEIVYLTAPQAKVAKADILATQAALDRDCIDRAMGIVEEGRIIIDVKQFRRLKIGFDVCCYVGYKLGLSLMDRLGADFAKAYPPTMNPACAKKAIGEGGAFEMWEAWARLMRMRAYVKGPRL